MSYRVKILMQAMVALVLIGCRSHSARLVSTETIQVISDPPGARIEVNNNYVGNAPCIIPIRCNSEGRFLENTLIRAVPVGSGYTQTKYFRGYAFLNNRHDDPRHLIVSDAVPSRLSFDMNARPAPDEFNIKFDER